jgi:ribosomal protein S27E
MIVTCSECGWQQAEHSRADFRCLICGPKVCAPPGGLPRRSRASLDILVAFLVVFVTAAVSGMLGWVMGRGV